MDTITFISKFEDTVAFTRDNLQRVVFVNGKRIDVPDHESGVLHSYRIDGKLISLVGGVNEDFIEKDGIRAPLTEAKFIDVASGPFVFILTGKDNLKYLLNTYTMKRYKVARTSYDLTCNGTVLYYDELGRQMFKTISGKTSFMKKQDVYHVADGNKMVASKTRVLALNNGFEFHLEYGVVVSNEIAT